MWLLDMKISHLVSEELDYHHNAFLSVTVTAFSTPYATVVYPHTREFKVCAHHLLPQGQSLSFIQHCQRSLSGCF